MMLIGNVSLVVAILTWNFVRPAGIALHAWWFDGLTGLLFGISTGANLFALRCARRGQSAATEQP